MSLEEVLRLGDCLTVTKQNFYVISGFCEGLAVADNDVDFCYDCSQRDY